MFAFPETKLREGKEISVIKPNTVHQLRLLHEMTTFIVRK